VAFRFGLFSSFGTVAGPPLGAAGGGARPHTLWGPVGATPARLPDELEDSPLGGGVSPGSGSRSAAASPMAGAGSSRLSREEMEADIKLKVPAPPDCF